MARSVAGLKTKESRRHGRDRGGERCRAVGADKTGNRPPEPTGTAGDDQVGLGPRPLAVEKHSVGALEAEPSVVFACDDPPGCIHGQRKYRRQPEQHHRGRVRHDPYLSPRVIAEEQPAALDVVVSKVWIEARSRRAIDRGDGPSRHDLLDLPARVVVQFPGHQYPAGSTVKPVKNARKRLRAMG